MLFDTAGQYFTDIPDSQKAFIEKNQFAIIGNIDKKNLNKE